MTTNAGGGMDCFVAALLAMTVAALLAMTVAALLAMTVLVGPKPR